MTPGPTPAAERTIPARRAMSRQPGRAIQIPGRARAIRIALGRIRARARIGRAAQIMLVPRRAATVPGRPRLERAARITRAPRVAIRARAEQARAQILRLRRSDENRNDTGSGVRLPMPPRILTVGKYVVEDGA